MKTQGKGEIKQKNRLNRAEDELAAAYEEVNFYEEKCRHLKKLKAKPEKLTDYETGLYNGLELAVAALEDREPVLIKNVNPVRKLMAKIRGR